LNEFEFKIIEDLFFLCSMGLPGGGRTIISNRITKHFNIMIYTLFSDEVIRKIYLTIFDEVMVNYTILIKELFVPLVNKLIEFYNKITSTLLPIPKKPH